MVSAQHVTHSSINVKTGYLCNMVSISHISVVVWGKKQPKKHEINGTKKQF